MGETTSVISHDLRDTTHPDRNLALELVRVTEAAALAAARWVGRGDKESADQAAVDAMRLLLDTVPMDGLIRRMTESMFFASMRAARSCRG